MDNELYCPMKMPSNPLGRCVCEKDWIAVNSRTPEKTGAYLVVVQGLSVRFADRAFYDVETNIWKRCSYLSSKTWSITHWMPLPELPKKV